MGKELKVGDLVYDKYPNVCPHCGHAVLPAVLAHCALRGNLDIAFQCPRAECERMFIGQYDFFMGSRGLGNDVFRYRSTEPKTYQHYTASPEVAEISPDFVSIYQQALNAQDLKLDQIAGMGFRKAFEFLIKDYCILQHPEKAETIKKNLLGSVIGEFVADPNVKECAKRAVWLGNDETHYVRKWVDKDIEDLKQLINLSCHWIASAEASKRFIESMEDERQTKKGA